jgi:hypothetical protein
MAASKREETIALLPTWRQMNMDTSPEVEKRYFDMLRGLPAWRKMEMLAELNKMAIEAAYSGIKRRHPEASDEEMRQLLLEQIARGRG